ncbi:MAG: hypothetical protein ACJ76U_13790 [Gaiellaceae bacterium]
MMKSFKPLGLVGVVAVVTAAIAAALVGGASSGRAATSFTITLDPLIGTANVNEIPQVSYGGKIGYHLVVTNAGDSTTQHASVAVTSDLATFSDSDDASCAANPKNAHQMVCTPFGGTFAPGRTFDVHLRFTAPASGAQVSTFASISVSAQTVGGSNNNGTTLATSQPPLLTNIVAGGDKADTYLHASENAGTGNLSISHPQKFGLQLPTTLLGSPFGVALSIHDNVGTPICATCLPSWTSLTIPAASLVTLAGNPFYNGTTVNPYSWSMTAKYPSGYKFTAVVHVDAANVSHNLPTCQSLGGAPTSVEPMCYDADSLVITKSSKTIAVSGLGLENGNIAFG